MKIAVAKNDTTVTAYIAGSIEVISEFGVKRKLEDVLFVPEVPHNLLSVSRMQQKGISVIFDPEGVRIKQINEIIATGKPVNGLINITFEILKDHGNLSNISMVNKDSNYQIWHERLGHVNRKSFLKLKNLQMVEDVDLINSVNPVNDICESCILGKQTRLPFQKSKNKGHVKRPLFIIHSDICGPITPPTVDNKNYFVTFIDDFTHYTVVYLLEFKSEDLKVFKDFHAKSEVNFNCKIENLYCDNGGEYLSSDFKEYCVHHGISYHLSVPYTPEQNGVAERMNRTITEKARTMIITSELEKIFWGEAVLTATYLINLLPTTALQENKTPFELCHKKKPRLQNLKNFGSTVYILIKTRKTKFDAKSEKDILVGYTPNGYKIWNVDKEIFVIASDVIIDETNFRATRPVKGNFEHVSEPELKKTNLDLNIPINSSS